MTDKQFEQIEYLSKKLWGDINNGHEYSMVTYTEFLGIVTEVWEILQEEPVSVWHDSSEMPKEKKVCLIRYSTNGGASTNNFEVVIAEPLTRRFVTRSYPHKTGYQHTIHGENIIKVDEYQDRREYIPFSDIDEWAYIDDLLNLSNVQRTTKNWKEPVSEELEEASKNYALNNTPWDDCKDEMQDSFKAGTKWQKEHSWKSADGDDLPETDREVIAILDYDFGHYKVVYAHRPNPKGWDGTNIDTGEEEHFEPATYGKGGWNQPHVLYWLDAKMPYEEK